MRMARNVQPVHWHRKIWNKQHSPFKNTGQQQQQALTAVAMVSANSTACSSFTSGDSKHEFFTSNAASQTKHVQKGCADTVALNAVTNSLPAMVTTTLAYY